MTAYHIVEASPVPCTRSHGRGGIPVRRDAGFDQLVLGSDSSLSRIDEEDTHRTRG
jgi:hypothetical protein